MTEESEPGEAPTPPLEPTTANEIPAPVDADSDSAAIPDPDVPGTPTVRATKFTAIASILAILLYGITTLLIVMPPGTVKTAGQPLISLASPFFTQKWNVFAPNISRTNPALWMQAEWEESDGSRTQSDWVSITAIDFSAITHRPLPSRAHKTSLNLQSRYLSRFNRLNPEQKTVAREPFLIEENDSFRAMTPAEIYEELMEHGTNRSQVRAFMREDEMVREYVSYFAAAYFEVEPTAVRWQTRRQYPNKFADRHAEETVRDPSQTTLGWRAAFTPLDPAALDVYRDYIDRRAGER